jgi:hypothetical protein
VYTTGYCSQKYFIFIDEAVEWKFGPRLFALICCSR